MTPQRVRPPIEPRRRDLDPLRRTHRPAGRDEQLALRQARPARARADGSPRLGPVPSTSRGQGRGDHGDVAAAGAFSPRVGLGRLDRPGRGDRVEHDLVEPLQALPGVAVLDQGLGVPGLDRFGLVVADPRVRREREPRLVGTGRVRTPCRGSGCPRARAGPTSTSRRAVMHRPCGGLVRLVPLEERHDDGGLAARGRAADPVDPVVDQRGHFGTPVRVQAQAEQIGLGDLEQPGRADADGQQLALLTTADPFQPEDRAPLLDAAEVVPAPAVLARIRDGGRRRRSART